MDGHGCNGIESRPVFNERLHFSNEDQFLSSSCQSVSEQMMKELPGIEPSSFWRALGMRAIGGAIVTARSDAGMAGFLALSVTHLTSNPPTLTVSIGKTTSALAAIQQSGYFAVNYLAAGQAELADVFGGRTTLSGAERFQPDHWQSLVTGAPVLNGAVGTIECELVEEIERYDSVIAIGRIVNFTSDLQKSPVVFFAGKKINLGPPAI